MRYAKIRQSDISNGKGVRVSLFTQGCFHRCKGCFNPETWDFHGGKAWTEDTNKKIIELLDKDYISGLSILGGDPLCYYESDIYNKTSRDFLKELLIEVKTKFPNKDIWLWTGYNFEDIFATDIAYDDSFTINTNELLKYIDVLIDGKFIEEKKIINGKYYGSSNQRIIDVQKSLKQKNIVLYEE